MISPLSSVSPESKLGENVVVDSFSTIFEDVIIGDGTRIHPNVTIYPGTRIGKNCEIFPGAVIGVVPQDLKFEGEYTTVEIGDNTKIRECVTIHRGTKDKLSTRIGSNCLLMTYVHVAHDCQIGNNVILARPSFRRRQGKATSTGGNHCFLLWEARFWVSLRLISLCRAQEQA